MLPTPRRDDSWFSPGTRDFFTNRKASSCVVECILELAKGRRCRARRRLLHGLSPSQRKDAPCGAPNAPARGRMPKPRAAFARVDKHGRCVENELKCLTRTHSSRRLEGMGAAPHAQLDIDSAGIVRSTNEKLLGNKQGAQRRASPRSLRILLLESTTEPDARFDEDRGAGDGAAEPSRSWYCTTLAQTRCRTTGRTRTSPPWHFRLAGGVILLAAIKKQQGGRGGTPGMSSGCDALPHIRARGVWITIPGRHRHDLTRSRLARHARSCHAP